MFTFSFGGEAFPVFVFETYIGNAKIESIQQQMPLPMAMDAFANQVVRLSQENQPMKLVCIGKKEIEIKPFEWVEKPVTLTYYNNKWDGEFN